MDFDKFQRAIDNLSDIVVRDYFDGNKKLFESIVLSLHEKIDAYPALAVQQPISMSPFKNYMSFLPYCLNEPNLIGSILYLNLVEPAFLLSDINSFSNSDNIKWGVKPTIESIAAAEQLFQNAKQKLTEILKSPKIYKKDTNELLKLIEPLSGAKHYNDIQQIYWMLYCELRFTLQLLKPDKDFDLSFGFDKHWLDLREKDVPLLKILSQTSMEDYLELEFDKTTKEEIDDIYIKTEKRIAKPKIRNQVSDSAPISLLGHMDGISWDEIFIELVSNDSVKIKARDFNQELHFSDLGMSDKRSYEKYDRNWELLALFAENNGIVHFDSIHYADSQKKLKKSISNLRKHLNYIFGIDDSPIENYQTNIGYKAKFYIKNSRPDLQ